MFNMGTPWKINSVCTIFVSVSPADETEENSDVYDPTQTENKTNEPADNQYIKDYGNGKICDVYDPTQAENKTNEPTSSQCVVGYSNGHCKRQNPKYGDQPRYRKHSQMIYSCY